MLKDLSVPSLEVGLLVLKVYYLVGYHRVGNKLGGVKVFFVHINSGYLMSVVGGVIVNALFQYCSSLYKWLSHTCSLPPRSSLFAGQLSLRCGKTDLRCPARLHLSVSSFSQMRLLQILTVRISHLADPLHPLPRL